MAISYVGAGAVVRNVVNPTVAVPAGVVERDLLIIITTSSGASTVPSGWTSRFVGANVNISIFYKFADATNPSVTIANASTGSICAVMIAYRGVGASDTISTVKNATATNIATNTLVTSFPNEYVISVYTSDSNTNTWGVPASTTARVNAGGASSSNGLLVVDELQAAAGTSTIRTATVTTSRLLSCISFAIVPGGDKYWVGGTGTWNTTSTTNWSLTSGGAAGAPPPGINDSAIFDQAGTYTVTMTGALACFNMTVSAGTVTFATGTTPTLAVSASMSLVAGTIWTNTGAISFTQVIGTTRTITTNGVTINSPITFLGTTGSAGIWSLGSALTTSTTVTTTLTAGTLTLASNLTTGSFITTGTGVRAIAFSTNQILLTGNNATIWDGGGANISYTGTVTIVSNYTGSVGTRTINVGTGWTEATAFDVKAGSAVGISIGTSGTDTVAIAGNLDTLDLTGMNFTYSPGVMTVYVDYIIPSTGGTVSASANTTTFASTNVTPRIITVSRSIAFPITFNGVGGAWSLGSELYTSTTVTTTLTNGTLTLNGFNLNPGRFSSNNANTRAIAFGTANIVLWGSSTILDMGTATNFTYTGTGGFTRNQDNGLATVTFGTTGGTTTNAPNLTVYAGSSSALTITNTSYFKNVDFTGSTCTVSGTYNACGNLTLAAGGTYTGLTVTMVASGTITPNGKTIAAFTVNNGAGTVTLAGALGVTTYTQTAGTIDFATFNLTGSGAATYTGGTLTNIGTITCTTFTINGPTYTFSSGTINPSTSFVLTAGSFTYASGANLGPVPTFTHTAGTVTLGQNYSLTSIGTYTLTAGTLDMTDRNLTAARFITSGTGVRAINFGTNGNGEITVMGNNATIWDGGSTGITYTGNPRIVATYTGAVGTRTVNLGTAWTEATAFDVTMQPGSYPNVYGFQIINGSTDIVAMSGVAENVSLTGFLFTFTPGVMTVYGDYTIDASGGTVSASASLTTFATTSSKNISISRSIDFPITFNGVGGTFNITASLTIGATRAMTLTAGSVVLSGSSSINTGTFLSTGTGTRSINFNNNNITLTNTVAATTVLSMADATGVTIAGSGGFISDLAVTKTFSFGSTAGGSAANAPNLTFTTGAAIPTITTGSWFNSLNFGSTTSSITGGTSIFVSTLTLASGGTYTGVRIVFTHTQTWTPQFGKQLRAIGVNIPGGTLTLGGTQSLVGSISSILTAGTLDLGGYDLDAGSFDSNNANTRAIVFGSNNIIIKALGVGQLSMETATGFTWTGSGGFVSDLTATRSFSFGITAGGSETNAPNLSLTSGAAIPTFDNNSWFNILDFTGTTATPATRTIFVNTLILATGGTYTGLTPIFTRTQTWTTQFSKELGGIGFNLAGGTLTLGDSPAIVDNGTTTLTAGTLDLNGFNIGTGIFSSSNTNTRSIAFGSNSILCTSHTTAATTVLNMAIATGFTWTGTGKFFVDAAITRTAVFGTTGGTATNAPNLAVSGTGIAIVTLTTGSWFNDLSFTTTAFALPATTLNIAGDLTLSSGGTFASLNLNTVGTGSILSNGKTIAAFTINSVSGTTTLGDALSLVATGITTLTSGALVLNNFTLTTSVFNSTAPNVRSIAFGSGNIVLATTTAAAVNLAMNNATNFTCTSSGTYGSGTGGFQSTMSVTRTFTFGTTGGSAANAPRLYLVSGASIPTITTGSWFGEIDFGTTAFTIAATNLNLSSLKSNLSTSVLTALTATMVGTGSIRTNTSIGPLIINTSAITTTLAGTTLCTTAALTQGTLDLASNTLTCSSTFTYNGGSLLTASSILNCTTFTVNGPAFDFTTGTITPSTSFVLTSGSFTLNGGTLSAVPAFTHTAGTVTFNTSYALTATGTYTFTAGTLSLPDGVTLSTGIFSSTNTNTRSIAFGATTAGYISLTHTTAATTRLSMAIATGFTESGPGGFTSSMGVTATFTFGTTGGSSSNAPILLITGGAAIPTITTGSWFNLLDFTGSTSTPAATVLNLNALTLAVGGTYTALSATMVGTGSILSNGKTIAAFTINSTSGTTTLGDALALIATGTTTLTSGTLDLNGFDLTTGIFSSSVATARSIVFGTNNIILSHTTLATTVLSMATATGFSYTGTGGFSTAMSVTRTFTFGTTGGSSSNAPNLAITSGASIPTITTGSWFDLLDFTGSTSTPAVTFLNIKSLTLASGGTYTSLSVNMMDIGTITPNGKTIAGFTVNHLSTTTLAGALGCTTYTQTSGTVDFATFNLTCSGAAAYTSGTLNNIGTISCTTWTVTGAFTFGQGTITPSTSFVLTSGSFTYSVGATLSAVPTFTHTAGTVTLNQSYALTATGTYTLTAGTLTLADGVTVNTGIFSSTGAGIRAIAFGSASAGNINLTHTTAATVVLNMAALGGFSFTGTGGFTVANMSNTRTFSVGSTSGGSATIAPSLTFTTGASIATLTTASWFKTLSFGTTAFDPGTTALNIAGDLTLSSSGTYTTLTPTMRGTGTITSNGKTLPALTVNTTGTATLADALTASGAITLTQGTLDCSTFSVTSATFASTGSLTRSMGGSGTYTITGAGATAFSNASATGITIDGLTISMTAATAKTFAGGGGSFATLNQGGAGALTISGNNSFSDLTATTRPSTVTFTASSTQTFADFTLSGVLGSLVTINSSIAATRATLSKSSGTVSVGFLSIRDSNATGGAEWYAGTTSTNVSNNLGWIFTAPPGGAYAGNFFAFF